MYRLYAFPTPNSIKTTILLEELDLPYELKSVNVKQGEQRDTAFLALNPNGKIPVLLDTELRGEDGELHLTESAAIMVYLAEKHGRFLPRTAIARARVFEQLFFHASALSPAFGQAGFFLKMAAEPQEIAITRFQSEAKRVLGLLNDLLARQRFVAGDEYSIADIAHFGWIWRRAFANVELDQSPHVARWFDELQRRPAVIRAIARLESLVPAA